MTMCRFLTSSANSAWVQWLIGLSDFEGGSQATAAIWTICSAVKVAGPPGRGASSRAASMSPSRS